MGVVLSFFGFTNFDLQVAKGNVPGHSWMFISGLSAVIGTSFTDISTEGGNKVLPSSAVTLDIVSTSTADTNSAGTGARTVLVTTLDGSYNEVNTMVNLNGTTAVTLAGTHLRVKSAIVIVTGTGRTNAGTVTVEENPSPGNVLAQIEISAAITQSTLITMTDGFTGFARNIVFDAKKGVDLEIVSQVNGPGATSVKFRPGSPFLYQNNSTETIDFASGSLDEQFDFRIQAKAGASNSSISVRLYQIIIDNDFL